MSEERAQTMQSLMQETLDTLDMGVTFEVGAAVVVNRTHSYIFPVLMKPETTKGDN